MWCAYSLYRLTGAGSQVRYPASDVLLSAAGFAFLYVILLERRGGYRPYVSLLGIRDTERVLRVTLDSFLLGLLVVYLRAEHLSRLVVLLALVTVPVFVTLEKLPPVRRPAPVAQQGFRRPQSGDCGRWDPGKAHLFGAGTLPQVRTRSRGIRG